MTKERQCGMKDNLEMTDNGEWQTMGIADNGELQTMVNDR